MRSDGLAAGVLAIGAGGLLAGAYAFQYIGGLPPCEMCWWQRYALMAVLFLSVDALVLARAGQRRPGQGLARIAPLLLALAFIALAANIGIAIFHAGVEQHWWQGITRCTAAPVAGSAADVMADIMSQPLVRCDAIPWSMGGVSMAGWNAITSTLFGGVALWLTARR